MNKNNTEWKLEEMEVTLEDDNKSDSKDEQDIT